MPNVAMHSAVAETTVVREQVWAVYLLAWVAAFTDAIGYLSLHQLGASYMSGNSMNLGIALGREEWFSVINHGFPIFSFVTGNLLGVLIIKQANHRGVRNSFALIFGFEAVCILAFLFIGTCALHEGMISNSETSAFYFCMFLLTLAMGLQTTTLRKVRGNSAHTTFVTGALVNLTEAFINYFSWIWLELKAKRFRQILNESRQQKSFQQLLLLGGIWICYVFGAICGSVAERRFSLTALLFPIGALVTLIILDFARPFENSNPN
ncbi:MAG TPA: YoaK family protein [Pyrinomonadaceae bacterium]|jgi:uncharacterized membrane protein YoaK (UPF0700 family)